MNLENDMPQQIDISLYYLMLSQVYPMLLKASLKQLINTAVAFNKSKL